MKKKTGNTFTANAMPMNYAVVGTFLFGCSALVSRTMYNLANGTGKIQLE